MPAKKVKKVSKSASKSQKKVVAKKPVSKAKVLKKPKPVPKSTKKVSKSPAKKVVKSSVSKKPAPKKASSSSKTVKKVVVVKQKMKIKTPIKKAPKTVTLKAVPSQSSRRISASEANLGVFGIKPYPLKKDEEYMNVAQGQHFINILNTWKQALMTEVDMTITHMKDDAANFPDPNDRASQEEEFSLELRARDRERKLLKKIEETLERIKNHDYGYCDACGVDIGIRRLEARPTATLCIDCKTLAEIKERQVGG